MASHEAALRGDQTPSNPSAGRRKGLVAERCADLATELLNPLLDVLGVCREACGGDLDKFLIFLVIAVRSVQHPGFKTLTQRQVLSGEVPVFPSLRTNVRSISDSLRMPRESVRRKVSELMGVGWVVRRGTDLFITAEAYRKLAPVQESLGRLALRCFEKVAACLDDR